MPFSIQSMCSYDFHTMGQKVPRKASSESPPAIRGSRSSETHKIPFSKATVFIFDVYCLRIFRQNDRNHISPSLFILVGQTDQVSLIFSHIGKSSTDHYNAFSVFLFQLQSTFLNSNVLNCNQGGGKDD